MSVKHIDKGLDLLVKINAIDKWSYQIPTNTYTVYGALRETGGISHKIYDADELFNLGASELYARILIDFQARKENTNEMIINIETKLNKLITLIESKNIFKTMDVVDVNNMLLKLYKDKKLPRKDLEYANELWQKYK